MFKFTRHVTPVLGSSNRKEPKLKRRQAYQVVREDGLRSVKIGWKGRLLSKRRASKVCRFLSQRGHDVRVRYFGEIVMPESPWLFDLRHKALTTTGDCHG